MNSKSLSPGTARLILVATILASSMAFIDGSALGVALPALQKDLGADATQLLWVVNGYTLFLSALILVGSALGDRFGRNRIFGTGIILFAGASIACGLAPSVGLLIAARAIQGVGGAMLVPGSLAIIAANFPAERRGTAIGTWSTFSTVTTIIGPLVGGFLAGAGLWRGIFFINAPLAIIALLALTRVPETRDPNARPLDLPGAALITVGLAAISFGFIEAPTYGLNSPLIVLALGIGLLSVVGFVWVEARSKAPMVPLTLFRSRTFSGANLLTLFLYGALALLSLFIPLYLIDFAGYTPQQAGLAFIPFALGIVVLSRFAGAWMDRVGPRPPLTIGPAIVGLGFLAIALVQNPGGPDAFFTTYFPGIMLAGIGMGITIAPLSATVFASSPSELTGTASGVNNAVARTAGVLSTAIVGAIAIGLFAGALATGAQAAGLDTGVETALVTHAVQLSALQPPDGVSAAVADSANAVIGQAFAQVFRTVMLISAGLAWLSAILALILVERRATTGPAQQPQTPIPAAESGTGSGAAPAE